MTIEDWRRSILLACMSERAAVFGWEIQLASNLRMSDEAGPSEVTLLAALGAQHALPPARLPTDRDALSVVNSPYTVLLVLLETVPAAISEHVQHALWWASLVRSALPASRRDDLHIFFVGPAGASTNDAWFQCASEIEADVRVCRKLVWLPTEQTDPSSCARFIDRTFLAQPWHASNELAEVSLDPLRDTANDWPADAELAPREIRRWLDILLRHEGETGELARKLVEVVDERSSEE